MTTKADIKKHILVPKHEKVTADEKQAVFQKYNVTVKEMPKISRKDPAVRDLGAKQGDLIRITRESPTAGTITFYRVISDE